MTNMKPFWIRHRILTKLLAIFFILVSPIILLISLTIHMYNSLDDAKKFYIGMFDLIAGNIKE